ncbi:hypothetical protein [Quatrionicoccus australiensis]|uniref:hypothetical protein n=1 Tax=Quatrionicoccus australiensis TaxID=138118 RepID=UPI001CF8AF78|nr:hypothetical protein [Quatrionicoccus australiensis]UCV13770.1 hypothetical protein KI612_12475 [Quatrionicoccus australiensis]
MSRENREIRRAIAAKLLSVAGIGNVFEYERAAANEKAFRELYATDENLLGWHIRRVGRKEDAVNAEVLTDWEIRGFKAIQDAVASELAFDDLIDDILDAFRADPTLGKVLLYPRDKSNSIPDLADSGPVMFCGVLCHAAKLKFTTRTAELSVKPWD